MIGGAGFGGVALENVGASDFELGHRVEDTNDVDAAVIENFLEFGGGFRTVVKLEVGAAAGVDHSKFSIACAQFVFLRRLQNGDSFTGLVLVNQIDGLNDWSNLIFEHAVIRKLFHHGFDDFSRLGGVANPSERGGNGASCVTIEWKSERFRRLFSSAIRKSVDRVTIRLLHQLVGGKFGLAMLLR